MDVIDESVPVGELIAAVKRSVRQAGIASGAAGRDLRIAAVRLTVNTVFRTRAGGGLDLRVPVLGWKLRAGAAHTRTHTSSVDISLVAEDLQDRYELRDGDVEEALVEAITTIRAAVAAAGGDDPLVLREGTVRLDFAVTDQGTISVGVEGELTDEVTHTLAVTLVRPEDVVPSG